MTAAIGEALAGDVGATEAGATAGATAKGGEAVAKTAKNSAASIAPSSSAPTGTARKSAGSSGSRPRTVKQITAASEKEKAAQEKQASKKMIQTGTKRASHELKHFNAATKARVLGRSNARQILVTEFVIAVIIIALSPLTDKHKSDTASAMMKRMTAICALYIILGLVATGGKSAGRVAASFGGLVLVVLIINDRDIFVQIANKFNSTDHAPAGPTGTGSSTSPSGESLGSAVGSAIGDLGITGQQILNQPGPLGPGTGSPAIGGPLVAPSTPPAGFGSIGKIVGGAVNSIKGVISGIVNGAENIGKEILKNIGIL